MAESRGTKLMSLALWMINRWLNSAWTNSAQRCVITVQIYAWSHATDVDSPRDGRVSCCLFLFAGAAEPRERGRVRHGEEPPPARGAWQWGTFEETSSFRPALKQVRQYTQPPNLDLFEKFLTDYKVWCTSMYCIGIWLVASEHVGHWTR